MTQDNEENEMPLNPADIPFDPPFQMTPGEAKEAQDILKDLLSIEDPQAMAAAAFGLARKAQAEASQEKFYIYWIHNQPNGQCVNKGITTDKTDGENQLKKFQTQWPNAVITWRGPMDYIMGRRMLIRSNN